MIEAIDSLPLDWIPLIVISVLATIAGVRWIRDPYRGYSWHMYSPATRRKIRAQQRAEARR